MVVTLSGIITLASELQPINILLTMLVMSLPIVTLVRELQ